MTTKKKNLKTCPKGHKFYKSSDCPVCPICEADKKPASGFLSLIGAPARRALENEGISTLKKLSTFHRSEIAKLHGMGPNAIAKLILAMKETDLEFKQEIEKVKPGAIVKSDSKNDQTIKSETEKVDAYMKSLKHPMVDVAKELRRIIMSVNKSIGEEIKWNAPAFFFTGKMKPFDPKQFSRHIVVFNFYKNDCLRLIFLNGAKVKDTSGLLEGSFKDNRKLANFYDLKDVKGKEKSLKSVVKRCLENINEID